MPQSSVSVSLQCEQRTLRELRMKNRHVLKKGNLGCENTGYWSPDSWSAYEGNGSSEPRLLHLPMHRKVLNSLTCNIWFSLINNNIWCSVFLPIVTKLIHVNVWQKPLNYYKVISLQLIKINGKKRKKRTTQDLKKMIWYTIIIDQFHLWIAIKFFKQQKNTQKNFSITWLLP